MLVWDYFDSMGALKSLPTRSEMVLRLCRERPDGEWDYFPRGFGKPGYQIDWAVMTALVDEMPNASSWLKPSWTSRAWLWRMAGMIPIILYLRSVPPGALPRVLLIGLVGSIFIGIAFRIYKLRRLKAILQRSSKPARPWSAAERRSRNIALWRQVPPMAHGAEFLYFSGLAGASVWAAIGAVDDSSLLIRVGSLPLAVLVCYLIVTLLRLGTLAMAAALAKAPAA